MNIPIPAPPANHVDIREALKNLRLPHGGAVNAVWRQLFLFSILFPSEDVVLGLPQNIRAIIDQFNDKEMILEHFSKSDRKEILEKRLRVVE